MIPVFQLCLNLLYALPSVCGHHTRGGCVSHPLTAPTFDWLHLPLAGPLRCRWAGASLAIELMARNTGLPCLPARPPAPLPPCLPSKETPPPPPSPPPHHPCQVGSTHRTIRGAGAAEARAGQAAGPRRQPGDAAMMLGQPRPVAGTPPSLLFLATTFSSSWFDFFQAHFSTASATQHPQALG